MFRMCSCNPGAFFHEQRVRMLPQSPSQAAPAASPRERASPQDERWLQERELALRQDYINRLDVDTDTWDVRVRVELVPRGARQRRLRGVAPSPSVVPARPGPRALPGGHGRRRRRHHQRARRRVQPRRPACALSGATGPRARVFLEAPCPVGAETLRRRAPTSASCPAWASRESHSSTFAIHHGARPG